MSPYLIKDLQTIRTNFFLLIVFGMSVTYPPNSNMKIDKDLQKCLPYLIKISPYLEIKMIFRLDTCDIFFLYRIIFIAVEELLELQTLV